MVERSYTHAASDISQSFYFIRRPGSRVISPDGFEYLFECLNFVLWNPELALSMSQSVLSKCAGVVVKRYALWVEIEAERCDTLGGPTEESCMGNAPNDLGRLPNVQITTPVVIDKWSLDGHPQRKAQISREINCFVASSGRMFMQPMTAPRCCFSE
jgi:hypothetical protein